MKTTSWFLVIMLTTILLTGSISPAVFADNDKEKPKMMHKKYSKAQKKATITRESLDLDSNGTVDFDILIKKPKNPKNPIKVTYNIVDNCVHGSTHDTAALKLGFTTPEPFFFNRVWLTDGFDVWNKWFLSKKSTDPNHRIDLVDLPDGTVATPFPSSGDDVIQKNPDNNKGSFKHKTGIKTLDGQDGWKGTVFFTGHAGDYFFWTIFPAEGLDAPCDTFAAIGIDLTLDPAVDNKVTEESDFDEEDE
ncbi:MAG: hypothetical protein ACT4NT_02830 [Nitrososphaerota archaeon]